MCIKPIGNKPLSLCKMKNYKKHHEIYVLIHFHIKKTWAERNHKKTVQTTKKTKSGLMKK